MSLSTCFTPFTLAFSQSLDGWLTGKGYDQSQTTIDVNAPRSGKRVTPDNLKGQEHVFVLRGDPGYQTS